MSRGDGTVWIEKVAGPPPIEHQLTIMTTSDPLPSAVSVDQIAHPENEQDWIAEHEAGNKGREAEIT